MRNLVETLGQVTQRDVQRVGQMPDIPLRLSPDVHDCDPAILLPGEVIWADLLNYSEGTFLGTPGFQRGHRKVAVHAVDTDFADSRVTESVRPAWADFVGKEELSARATGELAAARNEVRVDMGFGHRHNS